MNWDEWAAVTDGMTGAELESLVNEAALLAARERATALGADHLRRCFAAKRGEASRRSADAKREAAETPEGGHDVNPEVAAQLAATVGHVMGMLAKQAEGEQNARTSMATPNGTRAGMLTENGVDCVD